MKKLKEMDKKELLINLSINMKMLKDNNISEELRNHCVKRNIEICNRIMIKDSLLGSKWLEKKKLFLQ